MATKKTPPPSSPAKKTLIKIAETVGTVVGEISVKKDQLAHAVDTVKAKIHKLTSPKEKVAIKQAVKKTAKKAVKTVKKKADTALKAATKKVNKVVVTKKKAVVKKAAVAKKAVKKAVKKAKKTAQRRR